MNMLMQKWNTACSVFALWRKRKTIENHKFTMHEHVDVDVDYNAGTGTVTCVKMCEECYQTDETPIHVSCEVSRDGNTLKCSCGFGIAH